jgi:hypothetical protein
LSVLLMSPQSKQASSMMGSFFGDGILSRSNSDISLTGIGGGDTVRRSNSEVSLAGTDQCEASVHHCLELGCFPDEAAELPEEQRIKFVRYAAALPQPLILRLDACLCWTHRDVQSFLASFSTNPHNPSTSLYNPASFLTRILLLLLYGADISRSRRSRADSKPIAWWLALPCAGTRRSQLRL